MAPVLGESFLAIDGVVSRTVADTALLARRAGRATSWATPRGPPDPPSRSPTRARARARAACASAAPSSPRWPTPRSTRSSAGGGGRPASCWSPWGTRWRTFDPPWGRSASCSRCSATLWAVGIGMTVALRRHGQRPRADAEDSRSRCRGSSTARGRDTQRLRLQARWWRCRRSARQLVSALAPYDALLTPSLAERPVPHRGDRLRAGHGRRSRAAGRFTPFTAVVNVTGQPAISLPVSRATTACPPAST